MRESSPLTPGGDLGSTPQVSIKVTKLNTQYLTLGSTPQEVKSGELPKGARGTIYEKNYIVKRVFRKPER